MNAPERISRARSTGDAASIEPKPSAARLRAWRNGVVQIMAISFPSRADIIARSARTLLLYLQDLFPQAHFPQVIKAPRIPKTTIDKGSSYNDGIFGIPKLEI